MYRTLDWGEGIAVERTERKVLVVSPCDRVETDEILYRTDYCLGKMPLSPRWHEILTFFDQ